MKSVRNLIISGMLAIGAFTAVTYTACTKDECKDVVCINGGSCIAGTCSCPPEYEGATCQTESRIKFLKSWTASDQIGSSSLVYTVAIGNGTATANVIISNAFSDNFFANTISATVSHDVITIADQKPDANGDYRVSGTGTYNSGRISWNYTITKISTSAVQYYTGVWQ